MPRAKKVVVKETTVDPVVITVKEHEEVFKYTCTLEFNGEVNEFRTNDIAQSLYHLRPVTLKTNVIFKAKSEEGECERLLLIQLAKMMWRSKLGCEIFSMRLIFK